MDQESIPESPSDRYSAAEKYWQRVPPSVDGMLGGFSHLSTADVSQSKHLLKLLSSKNGVGRRRAIDCGCGIGRITKQLLSTHFETVDMVDVTKEFIDASKEYLGEIDKKVGEKFCCGLQDFAPKDGHYDVIWVQWVSGHLDDKDFVAFFDRCKRGLSQNGVIVLKENVCSSDTPDFDSEDNSFTRPRALILDLFSQAKLQVIRERKQSNWPKGMYEVRMFVLRDAVV